MANLRNSILLLLRLFVLLAFSNSVGIASQWSEMNTGLADTNIRVVAVDPINPALVYAGTPGGLFKSTNDGMVWSNVGLEKVRSLAIDFINPNILYAGTEAGPGIGGTGPALFKSMDGGATWSNRRSPSNYDFSLLVMDPTDPKILYIGSLLSLVGADDIFLNKTLDGGENWIDKTSLGVGLGCCTLAIDRNDPNTLYAPGILYTRTLPYGVGLLTSTDGGTSWSPTALINSVTPATQPYYVNLVAIDSKNPNVLYAATQAYGSPAGFAGLFKSTDRGNTWYPVTTGLLDLGSPSVITAIVIDPDDPNVVYAATGGYRATDGQGVFKSIDGGKNWTLFNDGLAALNIRSLALAPGSPNVLYAGTSAGVFKNIDDEPIVTLNENVYCVGSPWSLTVSNTAAERSVRLLGTTNNRSWEVRDWQKTAPDGTKRENGVFAPGTEGTHYLRVEVDGMLSNVVSFVVSNCRPLVPAYGP